MLTIYLLRHGRQNSPLCNLDVTLSDEGRKQARILGKRLKEYGVTQVFSSDLIRAVETARIIRSELEYENMNEKYSEDSEKNRIFSGIREIDFGAMTGLEDDVIKEKFKDYYIKRDKMEEDIPYPGGENGAMVFKRMKPDMDKIIRIAIENKYDKIAIVSHGGAIRAYLAGILGMNQAKRFIFAKTMENCSITELKYDEKNGNMYVERINDYSHLESYDELLRKHFI